MSTFTLEIINPKDPKVGLTYEEIQDAVAELMKARPDLFLQKDLKIEVTLHSSKRG